MQPLLTRRALLRSTAAVPLAACAARRSGSLEPGPSLLVLVADDTSRICVGAYGNRSATTPHADRLAAEGLRFERAATPVGICVPSRASMYTGLDPAVHGATGFEPIAPGVRTWPEHFGPEVATGMLGKLHVEPPERFPFEVVATGSTYTDWREPADYERGFRTFLERARGRRFTAFVNFRDPHRPFHKRDESEGGAPAVHRPEELELFPFLHDTPETRLDLARYYDALKRADEALGRVLDVLDASGREGSTVVVFTSDNGLPFPFAKSTLYEPGINLPLVVRWPGVVAPGGVSEALVSLLDLLPTARELFGLPPDPALHGRSLVPLFEGSAEAGHDALFGTHTSQKVGSSYPVRSIRTPRHKYLRNLRPEVQFDCSAFGKSITWKSWLAEADRDPRLAARMDGLLFRPREQLFDLARDPWETENLAGRPEVAEVQRELAARLRSRMEQLADPLLAEW